MCFQGPQKMAWMRPLKRGLGQGPPIRRTVNGGTWAEMQLCVSKSVAAWVAGAKSWTATPLHASSKCAVLPAAFPREACHRKTLQLCRVWRIWSGARLPGYKSHCRYFSALIGLSGSPHKSGF